MSGVFDTLRRIGEALLDAVIPLRARSARTRERKAEDIPLTPTEHELLGAHITTLMDYRIPEVQDLIRSLKYDGSRYAAKIAADLVADFLREEVASLRLFSTKKILLVPIPLHKARERERGFNQIELVLRSLPAEFKNGDFATVAPASLLRARATSAQTKLSRVERIQNVAGAFECGDVSLLHGAHIFLIDDVTTTGATLLHAGEPLQKAGAQVSLIALARA